MKSLLIIIACILRIQFSEAQAKPDGPYKDYYETGELQKEGQYKNNKRVGQWKQYHKNGQISKTYSYDNGKLNREQVSYYDTGIVSHKTELEDNIYVNFRFFKSGNLESKRQLKSGYFTSFYESGAKEIVATYLEFDLVGEWKKYYESGQIEWIVTYKDGYRHGTYKNYYENGDLKLEGAMANEKLHGKEKRYLKGKVLEWEGSYSNGMLTHTWVKYNAKGKKVEKIKFKDGIASKAEFIGILKPSKVADGVIERVPVYPGCEDMLTNTTKKACMNKHVNQLIGKNFNIELATKLNLIGKQRIIVTYKIDKTGNVTEVKARAPHPGLAEEAIRVINLLPKMSPGLQRDQPVIMPFSIPIVFQVQK
ncbi:energy transducer TonB [Winogradskyella eckloniae]|uniref:energy transducer TonB n=1 Tax=Winogradskyella eckloniae TaxID=1089306 RepID=UPI00156708C6|nr:energy transducer TonB [Winogradskyella eckloniae]NRD21250.1 energy transducer TonB [Winogradskyella eckloniae]